MNKQYKYYFDYAATTPVDPLVLKTMQRTLLQNFANTASIHSLGQKGEKTLEQSRKIIAKILNAAKEEIIFTASATESNNLALKGIAFANTNKGNHLIVSPIEHSCVLQASNWLAKQGFKITKLIVDQYGRVDPNEVRKKITKETILVSVMHANNEIGTIEPIEEIGEICREKKVYFHTDASQTFSKIPLDLQKTKIDLLTASSHKIYGPKGAALLYIRQGTKIEPLLHGGGQERNLRASTINLASIAAFAKASQIANQKRAKENQRLKKLKTKLIKNIQKQIPYVFLNGHLQESLVNIINLRFSFVEGEAIVLSLDRFGISVSTGSACSSKDLKPSHVLISLGIKPEEIHGSIRISLGRYTHEKEIDYLIDVLPKVISKLRKISPFKENV